MGRFRALEGTPFRPTGPSVSALRRTGLTRGFPATHYRASSNHVDCRPRFCCPRAAIYLSLEVCALTCSFLAGCGCHRSPMHVSMMRYSCCGPSWSAGLRRVRAVDVRDRRGGVDGCRSGCSGGRDWHVVHCACLSCARVASGLPIVSA